MCHLFKGIPKPINITMLNTVHVSLLLVTKNCDLDCKLENKVLEIHE